MNRALPLLVVLASLAMPRAAGAAPSCAQLHDRLFGSNGSGGIAERYKALKAKIADEERAGQSTALTRDRAELRRLATSIVAGGKAASGAHCPDLHAASTAPAAGATGGGTVAGPGGTSTTGGMPTLPPGVTGPVVITMRSPHGCIGFNGTWRTPSAPIRIRDGSATLGAAIFNGTVNGSVFRGRYSDPQIGTGRFVFTLSDDRDSFDAVLQKDSGQSTTFAATCEGQS